MIRWLVGGWGGSVKKAAARRLRRASRTPPGGSEGSRRSYSPQSAAWAAQKCVSASRPRIRSCPFTAIPYFPPPGPGCRLVGRGERRRLDHRRHARDGARVQRRVEERRRRSVERGGAHAVGGGRGRRRAARGAAGAAGTGRHARARAHLPCTKFPARQPVSCGGRTQPKGAQEALTMPHSPPPLCVRRRSMRSSPEQARC